MILWNLTVNIDVLLVQMLLSYSLSSKSRYYKERQLDRKKRKAIRRRFVSIRHGRHVLSQCPKQRQSPRGNIKKWLLISGGNTSAVQTPGFSPPAPAPAKKTPAPGKKLRLRQKTCEN